MYHQIANLPDCVSASGIGTLSSSHLTAHEVIYETLAPIEVSAQIITDLNQTITLFL